MANDTLTERTSLALNAAWELECIGEALVRASSSLNAGDLLVRTLSLRVHEISHILMSALDDDVESDEEISRRLRGTIRGVPVAEAPPA